MKQRDEQLRDKLKQIRDLKKEQEERETEEMDVKLRLIDRKLNKSQVIHQSHLKRIQSEAKMKNDHSVTIFQQHL